MTQESVALGGARRDGGRDTQRRAAAARMRAVRARRARGTLIVPVEAGPDLFAALAALGLLPPDLSPDRAAVAEALAGVVARVVALVESSPAEARRALGGPQSPSPPALKPSPPVLGSLLAAAIARRMADRG